MSDLQKPRHISTLPGAGMSNTPPLAAAAAGVPERADPLPLAPTMTLTGQERIYVMRDDPAAYDQVSTPSNRRPNSVSTAGGHGSTRS